jgi:hypothetical protein
MVGVIFYPLTGLLHETACAGLEVDYVWLSDACVRILHPLAEVLVLAREHPLAELLVLARKRRKPCVVKPKQSVLLNLWHSQV